MVRWVLFAFAFAITACGASSSSSDDGALPTVDPIRGGCVKTNYNCALPAQACEGDRACTASGDTHWAIDGGALARDGRGKILGTIAGDSIEIIYGQKKIMGGESFVLGTSLALTNGSTVTAWVAETAFHDDTASLPSLPLGDPEATSTPRFWITGGDRARFATLHLSQDGTWISSTPASAYLASDAGTICVLYNTPGYGEGRGVPADVIAVNTGAEFTRAPNVPAIDVYTFEASGAKGPTMKFVYGHVVGKPNADRFGWIAFDALEAE